MAANQHLHAGFIHNGLTVYALQYALATERNLWLIVWLDERGNSLHPYVGAAEPKRRMVTVKPGESILHKGSEYRVAAVTVYRALGVETGAGSGGVKAVARVTQCRAVTWRVRSQAFGEFGVGVGSVRNRRVGVAGADTVRFRHV